MNDNRFLSLAKNSMLSGSLLSPMLEFNADFNGYLSVNSNKVENICVHALNVVGPAILLVARREAMIVTANKTDELNIYSSPKSILEHIILVDDKLTLLTVVLISIFRLNWGVSLIKPPIKKRAWIGIPFFSRKFT